MECRSLHWPRWCPQTRLRKNSAPQLLPASLVKLKVWFDEKVTIFTLNVMYRTIQADSTLLTLILQHIVSAIMLTSCESQCLPITIEMEMITAEAPQTIFIWVSIHHTIIHELFTLELECLKNSIPDLLLELKRHLEFRSIILAASVLLQNQQTKQQNLYTPSDCSHYSEVTENCWTELLPVSQSQCIHSRNCSTINKENLLPNCCCKYPVYLHLYTVNTLFFHHYLLLSQSLYSLTRFAHFNDSAVRIQFLL